MARIKFKTKSSSTPAGGQSQSGGSTPRLVRQQRKGGVKAGGVVLAVLGWLVALTMLVLTVIHARNTRQGIRILVTEKPKRAAQINADCQDRIDALAAEKKAITEEYNQKIELQEKLTYDIRSLEPTNEELASQAKKAERAHKQLSDGVRALKSNATLTTETVADLTKRLARLKAIVAKKRAEYERREKAMRAELMERREKRDTRELTHWYRTHKKTVFGPAAGVFTAELMYEKRQVRDALALYEEILKTFPDKANPYLEHCKQRIQRIQERERYEPAGLKVNRYAPTTQEGGVQDTNH